MRTHVAYVSVVLTISASLTFHPAYGQDGMLGFFTDHGDVGEPALAGFTSYDPDEQVYTLGGSGANMWFAEDQFHFVWRELEGDFILRARGWFEGEGVDPHRKLGLIVRESLARDAAYVDATVHGDGLAAMQFRRASGSNTDEIRSALMAPDVLQLERRGNRFTVSLARDGALFSSESLEDVDLPDRVFAGLFVCAHNPEVRETAQFDNVRIIVPPTDDYQPYRDFIGSNLEVLDLDTNRRRILYRHPASIQAPNWTVDGTALIYNGDGLLFRFDLESRVSEQIDSGDIVRNNNDHVLSFDGSMLGISSHDEALGGSTVYTMPVAGGTPVRITDQAPSYLHGWSPDAQWLVYTAERGDGNYDIYKIPAAGGEEVRLTTTEGLDDGSEFTPDGEWIYFNSVRTGLMEIWRMRPDGSEQEQVTEDALNNWFPHISPDGTQIVFLSYGQDVDPSDHPFYKQVYLRIMPITGGTPRVIAYVYGGQGTINVPSWSPDGRRIAFISNTDLP